MIDTLIAWLNPAALVREVLIGLFIAIVGGFAYARAEKEWERLTGYVSHRSRANRARIESRVSFYQRNPQLLPLHVAQMGIMQFGILFFALSALGILALNVLIDSGAKIVAPENANLAHIALGVGAVLLAFSIFFCQYNLAQMQAVCIAMVKRTRQDEAKQLRIQADAEQRTP